MAILVKNIKQLVQAEPKAVKFRAGKEMQHLPIIELLKEAAEKLD